MADAIRGTIAQRIESSSIDAGTKSLGRAITKGLGVLTAGISFSIDYGYYKERGLSDVNAGAAASIKTFVGAVVGTAAAPAPMPVGGGIVGAVASNTAGDLIDNTLDKWLDKHVRQDSRRGVCVYPRLQGMAETSWMPQLCRAFAAVRRTN